ncbi:MAG TPA: hypothetical protein VJ183_11525 [Chloroflexia bacterium]|nr:hypothetical protein [Chloroflexia bacterium]
MKIRQSAKMALAILTPLVLVSSTLAGASPPAVTQPSGFADDAFKNVWMRTDLPVSSGTVKRSYYWGPAPGVAMMEEYAEGPGGKRLVQYFDKSRMEINNPSGTKSDPFYVTNGLLTVELISGRMQVGNDSFITRYPAEIDLASDTDDKSAGTPTYASFRNLPAIRGTYNLNQLIFSTINRAGVTGSDPRYCRYNVKYSYYEDTTRITIPDVFWRFLNTVGPVIVNGKVLNASLSTPYYYATGFPIADAYWASVKIAGVSNTDVLIQPYERRVLTYVPSAPAGFQVQMGNIGRHYYDWRYGGEGKPTPPPTPSPPIRCNTLPIRGFGKVWADHIETQYALGCPNNGERPATVIQQFFERGQMIEVVDTYNYYGYGGRRSIYVLFDDNTTQRFDDTYVEGDPEPAIVPPSGLYVPKRGLGKLWREGTGARVRERLGWATAPETVAQAAIPPFPGPVPTSTPRPGSTPTPTVNPAGGGAIQDFEKGFMVYAGPVLRKIYVLYGTRGYNPDLVNKWLVYDDLFREP